MKWIYHELEARVIYSLATDPTTSGILSNESHVSKNLFR